jgi:enoyl-CoA hydratase/carnithine racemase
MGGGMELALACAYRIISNDQKTALALPEVKLGIMPGFGGTQRLPRLVGLTNALDLILTGKSVYARKARKIGLADEVTYKEILVQRALVMAKTAIGKPKKTAVRAKRPLIVKLLEGNPFTRILIYRQRTGTYSKRHAATTLPRSQRWSRSATGWPTTEKRVLYRKQNSWAGLRPRKCRRTLSLSFT